nr:MAG TPA: hypothetical protein [Caudoviricetes sp.]
MMTFVSARSSSAKAAAPDPSDDVPSVTGRNARKGVAGDHRRNDTPPAGQAAEKENTMKTTINAINAAQTPSKEHVEVRVDEWETGSGWSCGDSCEYEYDPEHQHTRDDLVDFVDDQLRLLLDNGYRREERLQRLKAYADDSISDTPYTMTVYAAHDDDDDNDYSHDEPIAVYRVWMSDVAKRLLEAEKDD